jgi:hypothetical protein
LVETSSTAFDLAVASQNRKALVAGRAALARLRVSNPALTMAITRAEWWLSNVGDYLTFSANALSSPHVTASADGEIVFEWWNGTRKLTWYITTDGVDFIQVSGSNIFTDMSDGSLLSLRQAFMQWKWLNWLVSAEQ